MQLSLEGTSFSGATILYIDYKNRDMSQKAIKTRNVVATPKQLSHNSLSPCERPNLLARLL